MGGRRSLILMHTVGGSDHEEPNHGSCLVVGMLEHLG